MPPGPLLHPSLALSDFEKAELWAFKMVYPSARIQGCNFHFNQLQLKQFKIISDYHSNEVLRIHLRCVYGLPFIPLTDVIHAWTKLKAVIWTCCPTQAMSKYITYFEKKWIFSSSSPPSLWNCCTATLNEELRTNNASEGATMRSNTQQLRTIPASGPSCQISGHSTLRWLRWSRSFSSSGRTSILSAPSDLDGALERKQLKDRWKPTTQLTR